MGVIYRARDPHIDRVVAIKALSSQEAHEQRRVDRFRREAQVAGQLSHENLVKVYDLGEQDGIPYIAMEYLEGTDLRTIIRGRIELLSDKKLNILVQVARGLAYAHKRGIVHRDIKPENIRFLEDGAVKIMDFGVAFRIDEGADESGLHGTIAYMAPERLEGKEATFGSDLWAVGVIAFELLTFEYPFPARNQAARMERIASGKPEPMDSERHLVHPALQAIIKRLLHRSPARRGSAEELVEVLEEFISEDATRRKEAQVSFDKALAAFQKGRLKDAVVGWEETLRLEPDHYPAQQHLITAREKIDTHRELKLLGKLAAFYLEKGKNDRALQLYQEVLGVDPHHTVAQEAVRMLGGLGELAPTDPAARARKPSARASARKDTSPEVRRAVGLVRKERPGEAIALLQDVLAREPDNGVAQDYLQRIVRRVRKRVLAEKELVRRHLEKGNASFQTERFQEAQAAWNRVLTIDEGNLIARKNLQVLSAYLEGSKAEEEIAHPEGQRFHQRFPGGFQARYRGLFALKEGYREAVLHRLSASGMALLTEQPVPVSAVIEVSFRLPDEPKSVTVLAQVVNSNVEPFGRNLVGTILLLIPEPYVRFLSALATSSSP